MLKMKIKKVYFLFLLIFLPSTFIPILILNAYYSGYVSLYTFGTS